MKKRTILILSSIFFLFDQIIKYLIKKYLVTRITILPSLFYLNYTENRGAAWGILEGYPIFLILLSLLFFFFLCDTIKKEKNMTKWLGFTYSLILGGLLGNLFDRIVFGYVTDYVQVFLGTYAFPIFNLADTFLVIGIFLWLIQLLRGDQNEL